MNFRQPSVNKAKVLQLGREQKAEGRDQQHDSWIGPIEEKAEEEEENQIPVPVESGGRGKYRLLLQQPTHHGIYCCITSTRKTTFT